MLYNEFVEGTGCKDNEHNYNVYKNLEVMYMNSDMSKVEVYEYGKKLVDNSKSEAEIKADQEVNEVIADFQQKIEWAKDDIERYQSYIDELINTIEDERHYKSIIKNRKGEIRDYRSRIRLLKGC